MADKSIIVVAFSGPKPTINEAILLMAQNVANAEGEPGPTRSDDPATTYDGCRSAIETQPAAAFAGSNATAQYLDSNATTSFFDNGDECSLAIRYSCDTNLNDGDLKLFTDALNGLLASSDAYNMCVISANASDNYETVTVRQGKGGALDSEETLTSGKLLEQAHYWFKKSKVDWLNLNRTVKNPTLKVPKRIRNKKQINELAKRHATSLWDEWNGESVKYALLDAYVLTDYRVDDEDEADLLLKYKHDEVIRFYFDGGVDRFECAEMAEYDDFCEDGEEDW